MDCLFCNSSGQITAFAGTSEEAETWDCPDCQGTGQVTREQGNLQENSKLAMEKEIAQFGGTPK